MKAKSLLPNRDQWLVILGSLAIVAALGLGNYWIGWQISFAIFYLLPIFLCVHHVGRWAGLLMALIAGATWFAVDQSAPEHYVHPIVGYWNGTALVGFFVIFTMLLASIEEALQRQKVINRNLESLMTLAPSDKRGWDFPSGENQAAAPAGSWAAAPLPPDAPLPFEQAAAAEPKGSAANGEL